MKTKRLFDYDSIVGAKRSSNKAVALFPPKSSLGQSSAITLPPTVESIQEISTADDRVSLVDDDMNYTEDKELVTYDDKQASQYGVGIIFLRKRVRQVNFDLINCFLNRKDFIFSCYSSFHRVCGFQVFIDFIRYV